MGCSDTGASADHRFDLALKPGRTKHALLLHVSEDLSQAIVTQRVLEQRPVRRATRCLFRAETQILGVGNHHGVGRGMGMGAII